MPMGTGALGVWAREARAELSSVAHDCEGLKGERDTV